MQPSTLFSTPRQPTANVTANGSDPVAAESKNPPAPMSPEGADGISPLARDKPSIRTDKKSIMAAISPQGAADVPPVTTPPASPMAAPAMNARTASPMSKGTALPNVAAPAATSAVTSPSTTPKGAPVAPMSPSTPAAALTPPPANSAVASPEIAPNGTGKSAFAAGAQGLSAPGTPTNKASTMSPAPSAKLVLQEALKSLHEGSKENIQSTFQTVKSLRAKQPINVTLDQLVKGLFFAALGFQLLLIKVFRPSPWWLMVFTAVGVAFGLALSFLFYANKKRKAEACDVLGINIGLKGLQYLVGTLPSWLNYTEREKVSWLNKTLLEVWPFYDKGVCKMVKKQTETIFAQTLKTMRVPGIKKIAFKQLTFGDAPFRVESIHVNDKTTDAMVMELDVRWCGEANITLAIELSAGDFAKMCPRVTDISFVGNLRIYLKPLVDTIPGFGAAVVTFRKPPRFKYRLDFGAALGGKYTANVVKPFINHVIDDVIVNMLVWPQRIVVPIINTEEMQVEIQKLAFRNQGMIKVTVIQANDLKKADVVGSSDPFTELTTDGRRTVHTKVIKNSLTPHWDQTFWLLVQEPQAQEIKLSVYDKDLFSPTDLFSTSPTSAFGSKELLGRSLIKLASITAQEPEPVTKWYHLGEGEWSNAEGCGKGCGRIQLTALYRGFESFTAQELSTAENGVLMVRVQNITNLPRGAGVKAPLTAYVRIRCGHQVEETGPVTSKADHQFTNRNVFEFYDVKYSGDIKMKVMEATPLADDEIAELELGVSDIASASDINPLSGKKEYGLLLRTFNLENTGGASMVVELRYAPYFGA